MSHESCGKTHPKQDVQMPETPWQSDESPVRIARPRVGALLSSGSRNERGHCWTSTTRRVHHIRNRVSVEKTSHWQLSRASSEWTWPPSFGAAPGHQAPIDQSIEGTLGTQCSVVANARLPRLYLLGIACRWLFGLFPLLECMARGTNPTHYLF